MVVQLLWLRSNQKQSQKDKSQTKSQNFLLLNLAVSDLALCLCILLISLSDVGTRTISDTKCKIHGALFVVFACQSLLGLLLIAIDRWMAVVHAVGIRPRVAVICIGVELLVSLVLACAPLLGFNSFVLQPSELGCMGRWTARGQPMGYSILAVSVFLIALCVTLGYAFFICFFVGFLKLFFFVFVFCVCLYLHSRSTSYLCVYCCVCCAACIC